MYERRSGSVRAASALAAALCCLSLSASILPGCRSEDTPPTVRSWDELPIHTYPISGSVEELFADEQAMADLARQVRMDITSDLEHYRIEDRAALAELHETLMNAAVVESDFPAALAQIEQVRRLQSNEVAGLMAGFPFEAIIRARIEAGEDETQFHDLVAQRFRQQLDALPWDKVGRRVLEFKGIADTVSHAFLVGEVPQQMDALLPTMGGALSAQMATALLDARTKVQLVLPVKRELSDACAAVIRARRSASKNVWPERSVTLDASERLTPVVVAIWDSGMDVSCFPGCMWVNEKEVLDGLDNDANGFIDDIHGIAHDLYGETIEDLLRPSSELGVPVAEAERRLRGYLDLHEALETDDAIYVRQLLAGLDHLGIDEFMSGLHRYGDLAHGTKVASVAAQGNPFIRLLVVRADYHMEPFLPTMESARSYAAAQTATVDYCKQANVHVVNMSWSESRGMIEMYLQQSPDRLTPQERAELARDFFKIISDSLYDAIRGAPDILFITSAGNLGGDVEFDEVIPSVFDLPNLIAVGGADAAGEPVEMSSYGERVKLFANGNSAEGVVPGGGRMRFTGTSAASPGVANLAAKLLAIDPTLTPVQLVGLMEENADPLAGDTSRFLINPKRTVDALRQKLAGE